MRKYACLSEGCNGHSNINNTFFISHVTREKGWSSISLIHTSLFKAPCSYKKRRNDLVLHKSENGYSLQTSQSIQYKPYVYKINCNFTPLFANSETFQWLQISSLYLVHQYSHNHICRFL